MEFNAKKYKKTKYQHRTAVVSVPEMADFFDEPNPVWEVRGLTGSEFDTANRAGEKYSMINALQKAIIKITGGGTAEEMADGIVALVGMPVATSQRLATMTEYIVMGSVNPTVDLETAVKMRENNLDTFTKLSKKISELSGMGLEAKKKALDLWRSGGEEIRIKMIMCERLNKSLFELCPDIAPYDFLTDFETTLWGEHFALVKVPK